MKCDDENEQVAAPFLPPRATTCRREDNCQGFNTIDLNGLCTTLGRDENEMQAVIVATYRRRSCTWSPSAAIACYLLTTQTAEKSYSD
jgi:hypothetical protein